MNCARLPTAQGIVDGSGRIGQKLLTEQSCNQIAAHLRSRLELLTECDIPPWRRPGTAINMTARRFKGTSRRGVLEAAGAMVALPLLDKGAEAASSKQGLTALAQPAGTDLESMLASANRGAVLYAGDFGVVGDRRADDTQATQAFLNHCAAVGGRIAYFGALSVRITGPLTSRGVGIVFDPASYGGPDAPGFIASGANYTALTVLGSVADFAVTIAGDNVADIAENGRLERDRRPRINGIAFGTDAPGEIFAMSNVRFVRVLDLAGFGVRHAQCWDSTFLSVSVERCGTERAYAFELAGDSQHTCNESTWVRVQVERAVSAAIRIDPGALSCSFVKIHSERALARQGVPTWLLGGSCVYDSLRLTAYNPAEAEVVIVSNQANFRNLRAEQVDVTVNASGGTINFENPGAVLRPAANQNGIINIVGGWVSVLAMGAGWNLYGCRISRLEVGFMPSGLRSVLTGCVVDELLPQPGTTQGELVLSSSRVAVATIAGDGRLRALLLNAASVVTGKGGVLRCIDQAVTVDSSSRIEGNVELERATLRLSGTIAGNVVVNGPVHDARANDSATVEGKVTGWGPPTVAGRAGEWSTNVAAAGVGRDEQSVVIGWRYLANRWRVVRTNIGD